MSQDELTQKMNAVIQQADNLHRQLEKSDEASAEIARQAIGSLLEALEELHVTQEELTQTNAELEATYFALEQEKHRYQDLFESAPDGYLVTNPQGIIQEANQVAAALLGYQPDHLVGKPVSVFVDPEETRDFRSRLNHLAANERSTEWELTLKPREGQPFPVALTVGAVSNPKGEIANLRWILRDITERKRVEEVLRKSEDKFKHVFETANVGKSITLPTGEISVNKAFADMLGYSQENLEHKTWQELTPPDEIEPIQAILTPLLQGEKDAVRFNKRYLHKNGSFVWADVSATVRRDQEGKPIYFITTIVDITKRKRAEDALRESENLLKNAAAVAHLGYYEIDVPTGKAVWSEETFHIFGLDPSSDEPTVEAYRTLLHPDDADPLFQLYQESIETQKPFDMIYRIIHSSGEIRHVHSLGQIETNPQGEVVKMFGTLQEITERVQAEEALRKSERELKKAQQVAHLGNWIWHIDNNHLEWSDEMYRIFGIDQDEFTGDLTEVIQKAIHPDDRAAVEQANLSVIQNKTPTPMEYRIIHPDGEVRTVWAEAGELTLDSAGNPVTLTGIVQDITDRKQAELALQESQQFVQNLADTIPNQLYVFDLSTGQNVYINQKVEDFFGLNLEQLQARGQEFLSASLHPDDLDKMKKFNGHWKSAADGQVFEQKYRLCNAQGEYRWLHSFEMVLNRDVDGKPTQIVGTALDITESVLAEQALRASEERHRLLFENASLGIGYFDLDGQLITFNAEAYRRLGSTPEDLAGMTLVEMFEPEQAAIYQARLNEAASAEGVQEYEDQIAMPQGEKWYSSTYTRITNAAGAVVGIQIISTDITVRKQAEAVLQKYSQSLEEKVAERTLELEKAQQQLLQKERLAVIGQMAAGMAHELRNPLSVIANAVYYLRTIQPEAHEKVKEYLGIIDLEKQAAERTVTDLLNFAQPAQPDLEILDVEAILPQILNQVPQPPKIHLKQRIPAQLSQIYADRLQIVQALSNLLRNAYQAMPDGGTVEIRAQETTSPEAGQQIKITIADEGEGISPENIQKLFDPLFTTRARALGMGLPIAQKSIEANGGNIEVHSQPGAGSQISVFLPIYKEKK